MVAEPEPYCVYGHYEEHEFLPRCINEMTANGELEDNDDPCLFEGCGHAYKLHDGGEDCSECNCTWFDTIGPPSGR